MESLQGQLLISSGGLFDPNFRHTVVLVGDHSADGAVGVVLNRVMDVSVAEAAPGLAGLAPDGAALHEGGPVDPSLPVLLAELTDPEVADVLVFDSVGFLVGEVSDTAERDIVRARIFAGYSGWGPGQLEGEIAEGSWIIDQARLEDVFTPDPDLLWSRVLERKGPQYRTLAKMPYDPSMN